MRVRATGPVTVYGEAGRTYQVEQESTAGILSFASGAHGPDPEVDPNLLHAVESADGTKARIEILRQAEAAYAPARQSYEQAMAAYETAEDSFEGLNDEARTDAAASLDPLLDKVNDARAILDWTFDWVNQARASLDLDRFAPEHLTGVFPEADSLNGPAEAALQNQVDMLESYVGAVLDECYQRFCQDLADFWRTS